MIIFWLPWNYLKLLFDESAVIIDSASIFTAIISWKDAK